MKGIKRVSRGIAITNRKIAISLALFWVGLWSFIGAVGLSKDLGWHGHKLIVGVVVGTIGIPAVLSLVVYVWDEYRHRHADHEDQREGRQSSGSG